MTPRGRKPIFPHPWLLSSKQSSGVGVWGGGTVVRSGGGGGQGDGGGGGYLCFKHTTLCSAEGYKCCAWWNLVWILIRKGVASLEAANGGHQRRVMTATNQHTDN